MNERSLCFPINLKNETIYLGRKLIGFGEGKINGFGGKFDSTKGDRTIIDTALRELREESGLNGLEKDLIKYAEIDFFSPEEKKDWDQRVHVYLIYKWTGNPEGSEEISCEEYDLNKIPYDQMWDTDQYWLPYLMKNKKIKAKFYFKKDCNTTEKYEITEVEKF